MFVLLLKIYGVSSIVTLILSYFAYLRLESRGLISGKILLNSVMVSLIPILHYLIAFSSLVVLVTSDSKLNESIKKSNIF